VHTGRRQEAAEGRLKLAEERPLASDEAGLQERCEGAVIGIGQPETVWNRPVGIAELEAQIHQRVKEVLGKTAEIGIISLPEEEHQIHIRGRMELPPPIPAQGDQRARGHAHRRQPSGDHSLAKERPDHCIGQARQAGNGLPPRGPAPMCLEDPPTFIKDKRPQGLENIAPEQSPLQSDLKTTLNPAQVSSVAQRLSPMTSHPRQYAKAQPAHACHGERTDG
jgi:hypothetical protein